MGKLVEDEKFDTGEKKKTYERHKRVPPPDHVIEERLSLIIKHRRLGLNNEEIAMQRIFTQHKLRQAILFGKKKYECKTVKDLMRVMP